MSTDRIGFFALCVNLGAALGLIYVLATIEIDFGIRAALTFVVVVTLLAVIEFLVRAWSDIEREAEDADFDGRMFGDHQRLYPRPHPGSDDE